MRFVLKKMGAGLYSSFSLQQIQRSYRMQHGVPQQQQHIQQQPIGQGQHRSRQQEMPGHAAPGPEPLHQRYQVNSGGQSYGQQARYQVGGVPASYQGVGLSPTLSQQSKAQSRETPVVSQPQPTSSWDPQGISAFGAAFESFLNRGSIEEVAEVKSKQPVIPSPPPTHGAIPVQTRRKSRAKGNSVQQQSAPLPVPAVVESYKVQELVEKVTKEAPNRRMRVAPYQIQAPQHQNLPGFNYNKAPLAQPDTTDFSSFFSPVKATGGNVSAEKEKPTESCEMTKRVSSFLKRVEQQHPAPGVWPSLPLPGPLDVQGPKVVQVKKGNLELIKSETLFVPADLSLSCTLCAKTFASEARLTAHKV